MYKGHRDGSTPIYRLCQEFLDEPSRRGRTDVILDLGARHGEGYDALADRCAGDYIMVEPSPRCAEIIRDKFRHRDHSRPQPHLIDGILGAAPGWANFNVFPGDDDQSGNLYSDRDGRYGAPEVVSVPIYPVRVLDAILGDRRIDLAKVNIEGGEYDLLSTEIFGKIDAFVMEAHNAHVPGKTWRDVVAFLGNSFDITSTWNLDYKYCALVGVRHGT